MRTVALLAAAAAALSAADTRYEALGKRYGSVKDYTLAAATYLGGDGVDECVAAAVLPDGRIAVIGNSWGPQVPDLAQAQVLGRGAHSGAPALVKDKKGRESLDLRSPDRSGFVAVLAKDGRTLVRAARCDWGVAAFTAALALPDGTLVVGGRAGPKAASLAGAKLRVTGDGGALLLAFAADGKPTWAVRSGAAAATVTRLWKTKDAVFAAVEGGGRQQLLRLPFGGGTPSEVVSRGADANGTECFLTVLADGTALYGGDRNTHTGKEPWRQPFLYAFDAKGAKAWTLWEWASKDLRKDGHPSYGLVSDSAPRAVDWDAERGEMVVAGWSDGGNSVFGRQPADVAAKAAQSDSGFTTYGMKGANSLAWIMRIDLKSKQQHTFTHLVGYCPGDFEDPRHRGAPNFASVEQLQVASNGDVIVAGSAASGLIQTAGAFWTYPRDGKKHGGRQVSVFNRELTRLRFASYLPGYDEVAIATGPDVLVIVGRAAKDDGRDKPTAPPLSQPLRKTCGGRFDGHVIVLTAAPAAVAPAATSAPVAPAP